MSTVTVHKRLPLAEYERYASEFLANQTVEDMALSVAQSTQQFITASSLLGLRRRLPTFTIYTDLILIYDDGTGKLRHVAPDNILSGGFDDDLRRKSWNLEHDLQAIAVFEYVSDSKPNKDYTKSLRIYESLKIPHYLIFDPRDPRRLKATMFRHTGEASEEEPRNERSRWEIPERDLEVGLHEGWIRFWYRGELLPSHLDQANLLETQRKELETQRTELDATRQTLARAVERLAKAAGRHDILSILPESSLPQLNVWLSELTSS